MKLIPEILWAQRCNESIDEKNVIYLTVAVSDLKLTKYNLTPKELTLEGTGDEGEYAVKIEFYKEINVDKSHKHLTGRDLFFELRKQDNQAEYWPRLTNSSAKHPYIKTDFNKWVDEDEQDAQPEDQGFGGMSGMSGMPGMGGDSDFDFSKLAAQMGDNGNLADALSPEMLKSMGDTKEGELEEGLAEESLDSIGERIRPEEKITTTEEEE